jgi:hypothetical protein
MSFVESDDVRCPSHKQHEHDEQVRVIGNAKYACECGCTFEWYGEHSWYIIHYSNYGVPEQYDLQSEDESVVKTTTLENIPEAQLVEDEDEYVEYEKRPLADASPIDILVIIILISVSFLFGACTGLMTGMR